MVRSRITAVAVLLSLAANLTAADRPIRKLAFDESASVVELFAGIEAKQFKVTLAPKTAQESNVYIKNLTDEPLTVALPKAAVGVHILPQFQFGNPPNNNGFFNNNNNGNNLNNGQQNSNGQSQTVGGTFMPSGNQPQGLMNQNNQNPFQGMNLFSIPPEKTVQLKLQTVCLNYGWPDPVPGQTYQLQSVDKAISNPALRTLLESFGPRTDPKAMQAAAWHLANGLNWNQLATVPAVEVNAVGAGQMFSQASLRMAQKLVEDAEETAKKAVPAAAPAEKAPRDKLTTTSAKPR